ncbi:MAG: sensor domain-containing diguanylate cyclase [Sulfurimicrobium sp.]|jgi:diguanylate cyclase (GGDEF)-like protein/PAS domain S-box-containing protein|nr:sensor domain-containing diguanylate cyclase [Sulfurimicrobium sp.]
MRALIRSKRFAMAQDEYSCAKFEDLRGFTIALGFAAVFLLWALWAWAWSVSPAQAPATLGWHLVMGGLLSIYPIAMLVGLSPRALPWLLYTLLMAMQGVYLFILTQLADGTSQGTAGFLFWFLVPPLLAFVFGWRVRLAGSLMLLLFPNLLVAVLGAFPGFDLLQFNLTSLPTMIVALLVSHLADQWLRQIHDLRKQLAWQSAAIASSGEALLVTDRSGRIEHVNPAFTASLGYTPEEVIGNKPSLLKSGFHDSVFYETMWTTLLKGQVWHGEIINRHKDDTSITLWMNIYPVPGRDGHPEKFVSISNDITAHKRLEEEVALGNAELEAIFDNAGGGIALLDLWGRFIKVNDFWLSMLGYTREETASLNHADISHDDDIAENRQLFVALASGELSHYESDRRFVRNGGRVFWGHLSMTPVKDDAGYIRAIIAIVQDINERKLLEEKLESMAHYDALTTLPNRALFFDRLGQAITQSKRSQGLFALMFVDLDGFKAVNDTFGHDTGDALLKAVSEHLLECVRESDTVARMGGDEFTIILRAIHGPEGAAHVAEKILATLSAPYHLLGHQCRIGASLGIVLYPQHGKNAEELLSQADNAMYAVKKAGKNAYRFAGEV